MKILYPVATSLLINVGLCAMESINTGSLAPVKPFSLVRCCSCGVNHWRHWSFSTAMTHLSPSLLGSRRRSNIYAPVCILPLKQFKMWCLWNWMIITWLTYVCIHNTCITAAFCYIAHCSYFIVFSCSASICNPLKQTPLYMCTSSRNTYMCIIFQSSQCLIHPLPHMLLCLTPITSHPSPTHVSPPWARFTSVKSVLIWWLSALPVRPYTG